MHGCPPTIKKENNRLGIQKYFSQIDYIFLKEMNQVAKLYTHTDLIYFIIIIFLKGYCGNM